MQLGHILFIDIVGYSKLLTNEQRELLKELNTIVRGSETFQEAEKIEKLVRLPTGDGMVLVFFTTPEAPVRCALEIAKALKREPRLHVRMGVNSGPVDAVEDVNDRANVAGAGINFAQRVMDCADAGHILLSKRVADDLAQYGHWKPYLHDLGEAEVKHGVPIALVNFYSDEIGNAQLPSKLQRAKEEIARSQRRKLAAIYSIIAVLIGLGAASWFFFAHRHPGAIALAEKGIAVLPFVNLSEQKENAFFADGMQDEVLTDLSRIADLKVISRTSVMPYRNAAARNLRQIAQELGVVYLLEGSVQRAAGKVRVIAQLIDARTDSHVWAKTFDKPLDDVFAVQSEIAETIAQQLHAQISPQAKAAIEQKPTSDPVAYDLYLQAKQLWHNMSGSKDWEADNRKAIDLLQHAVERDPHFGVAYGLLSQLHRSLYSWVDYSPARLEQTKAALDAAMHLAPDAAETYIARAGYEGAINPDYEAQLQNFARAAQLLPGDSDVLTDLGMALRRHARWDEAVETLKKARQLDPKGPNVPNALASLYLGLRQYTKCEAVADEAIKTFPDAPGYFLAVKVESALARGDVKLARQRLAVIPKEWDPSDERSLMAIQVELADRKFEEAKQLFASLDRKKVIAASEIAFAVWEAMIARRQGDLARSNSILLPFREVRAKMLAEAPTDTGYLADLSLLDAYLGRKEEAVGEAEKAVQLRPIPQNAVAGAEALTNLAHICALTGDPNRAIQLLEQVAAIPFGPSYGDLLMPDWDDLRADPRFEKITASLAPKKPR